MDILFHTRRKWNLACLTHGWRGSKINILNCLQFGYSDMTRWSVFKLILQLMFWTWRIVSGGLDSTVCQGRLQCAFSWEKDFWKLRGEERANIQGCNLSCYMLMKCLFKWIKEVVGPQEMAPHCLCLHRETHLRPFPTISRLFWTSRVVTQNQLKALPTLSSFTCRTG